jgi:hypothetical protein
MRRRAAQLGGGEIARPAPVAGAMPSPPAAPPSWRAASRNAATPSRRAPSSGRRDRDALWRNDLPAGLGPQQQHRRDRPLGMGHRVADGVTDWANLELCS